MSLLIRSRKFEDQLSSGMAWHATDLSRVLEAVRTNESGLSSAEAAERLQRYGPNILPEQPPPTFFEIVLRQFKSPLIYILGVAAVFSLIVHPDDPSDAILIAAVLALNAAIGSWQEWKAERSTRALRKILQTRASVLRDGRVQEIEAEELVPGDIVFLESGNRVPADIRLIDAHGLEVNESFLTGESVPVFKTAEWIGEEKATIGDRQNMVFAGAIVFRGRGKGVVVATGNATAVGQLALDVMHAVVGKPPLLERMDKFVKVVAYVILVATVFLILIGMTLHGFSFADMLKFGVALAVACIPEGLPVALTVALAVATTRMARRGVIVRRLAAVEGLGSSTLIASDKTGTLTCNELTVREIALPDHTTLSVSGEGFIPHGEIQLNGERVNFEQVPQVVPLLRAGLLCNEAELFQRSENDGWAWRGDPTDIALLSLGYKAGMSRQSLLEQLPQVGAIPFESERQFAASFHRVNGQVYAFVKGAPEKVLHMCDVDESEMQGFVAQAEAMAASGYRVLALAEGAAPPSVEDGEIPETLQHLKFLGLVGMIDPLRPGVKEAVAACQDAGITVCMVTGDHPVTALAISRELGLASSPNQVVTGRELESKTPQELDELIKTVRVFARTSPRQKLELVEAAQRVGHYVAVTGDGVNDAPALRKANIGIAMGKSGTDVAREAAELVITDDNFATIVAGVEEGRVAYDNVRKVIYLLISTGAGSLIMLTLAVLLGYPSNEAGMAILPLLPAQLLWLNLVTNGIQDVAMGFEPKEDDVLHRPPRSPKEPIFNRLMIERTIAAALVISLVGYSTFVYCIEFAGMSEYSARNILLLLNVLFQNFHVANCRSETKSAFAISPLKSPILMGGVVIALTVHVISMHVPFMQSLLKTEPVSLQTWITIILLAASIIVVMELHKILWRYRYMSGKKAARG